MTEADRRQVAMITAYLATYRPVIRFPRGGRNRNARKAVSVHRSISFARLQARMARDAVEPQARTG